MCDKFETFGLLYAHGELDNADEYESHLGGCSECASQVDTYKKERAKFYTEDVLGEEPSQKVSDEILRVCSKPVRAKFFIPMMFLKKHAATPIFIMLIMVTIGGYIQYHSMNAATNQSANLQVDTQTITDEPSADAVKIFVAADSVTDSGAPLPRPQGNLNLPGVVPVSGE